jgi:hypothetical protein
VNMYVGEHLSLFHRLGLSPDVKLQS